MIREDFDLHEEFEVDTTNLDTLDKDGKGRPAEETAFHCNHLRY